MVLLKGRSAVKTHWHSGASICRASAASCVLQARAKDRKDNADAHWGYYDVESRHGKYSPMNPGRLIAVTLSLWIVSFCCDSSRSLPPVPKVDAAIPSPPVSGSTAGDSLLTPDLPSFDKPCAEPKPKQRPHRKKKKLSPLPPLDDQPRKVRQLNQVMWKS